MTEPSQHELGSPPRIKISPRPLGEGLATHHHTLCLTYVECDDAWGVRCRFRISQHELRSPPRMKISPRPLGEGLGVRGYFRISALNKTAPLKRASRARGARRRTPADAPIQSARLRSASIRVRAIIVRAKMPRPKANRRSTPTERYRLACPICDCPPPRCAPTRPPHPSP